MNLMSDFTRGTELIVSIKGYSVPDESVWRELCYFVLLHAHALQQSFPAHSGLWYSPYVQVIFVASSLEISLLRYGRVTKAGDQLWFLRPLLWWRLEKHQVSKMQSTVLARDEKLNSLAPLEWDIVTTLGCGGRNCGPGVGRKAVSHGDPWAVHHPQGSPTDTTCKRDRPWRSSAAETEMLSNDRVSSDSRKQISNPNPS